MSSSGSSCLNTHQVLKQLRFPELLVPYRSPVLVLNGNAATDPTLKSATIIQWEWTVRSRCHCRYCTSFIPHHLLAAVPEHHEIEAHVMATLSFTASQERVQELIVQLQLVQTQTQSVPEQPPPPIVTPEPEPEPVVRNIEESLWTVLPLRYQSFSERVALERSAIIDAQALAKDTNFNRDRFKLEQLKCEGFFIPKAPAVDPDNLEVVAARMMRESGKSEDQYSELTIEPNPLRQTLLRALKDDCDGNGRIPTKFVRPLRIVDSDHWLSMTIDLIRIQLKMHDFFTEEDALSAQVEELYEEYQQRLIVDLYKYHTDQLRSLRELAQHQAGLVAAAADIITVTSKRRQLASTLEQIITSERYKDQEEMETRSLFARLYETWQELKEWRIREAPRLVSTTAPKPSHGYAGTRIRLFVQQFEQDLRQDEINWDFDLRQSVQIRQDLHTLRQQISAESMQAQFDVDQTTAAVQKQMKFHRRPPGQPQYEPILDRTLVITPDDDCSVWEQHRRRQIRNCRMHLALEVNGKKICQTKSESLEFPGFTVPLNVSTELMVLDIPQEIVIHIYRHEGLIYISNLLSNIYVAVPPFGSASSITEYSFAGSSKIVNREGRSDELGLWVSSPNDRVVKGDLVLSVVWKDEARPHGVSQHHDVLTEPKRLSVERLVTGSWTMDLDPNDPRNIEILELQRRAAARQKSQHFYAYELPAELILINPAFSVKSARRRVLKNRNIRQFFNEAIPLIDDHIPEHMFDEDEDKAEREHIHRHITNVSEVVKDDVLPRMTMDASFMEDLLAPRRKLRPRREHRTEAGSPSSCFAVIQIIRGQNLPVRRSANQQAKSPVPVSNEYWRTDTDGVDSDDLNLRLNPIVEVSFQQNMKGTGSALGPHPSWNETLSLLVTPPNNNYSPASILSMQDHITLNIFDLVYLEDYAKDSRQVNTRVRRTEKRWLGRVSIPIVTIYLNRVIEGHLRVQTPLTNLGYEAIEPARPTILYIFATMDPLLTLPPQLPPVEEWALESRLCRYASAWLASIKSLPQCRNREIMALSQDIAGNAAFLPHFLAPMQAPIPLAEDEYVRFVSRIPFMQDVHLGEGSPRDVWCSAADFMELLAGDWEEHAILLTNYFLASESMYQSGVFTWSSYVVLGMAIPEGRTCMVLRNKMMHGIVKESEFINAVTGDRYPSTDQLCPMVSVGCVFNHCNIWANIQATSLPSKISLQLDNPQCWRPFFDKSFPESNQSPSIYRDPPVYRSCPDTYYLSRAQAVERIIEQKFISWRKLPTYFDHGISQILRDTLQGLEFVAQGRSVQSDDKDIDKVRSLFTGMYGYPISFPDAGDDSVVSNSMSNPIVQALYEMKFHDNDNKNVRFARAVHIYPYPNGVGSLWVYFAALVTNY